MQASEKHKIIKAIEDLHGIKFTNNLNSGTDTLVYRGFLRAEKSTLPDKHVVVKISLVDSSKAAINNISEESDLLVWLNHENIVKFEFCSQIKVSDHTYTFLVVEYIDGKPLPSFVKDTSYYGIKPDPSVSLAIILKVLNALEHVHQIEKHGKPLNIIHGDISPDNVILSKNGQIKLIDFGVARSKLFGKQESYFGKGLYSSPELLQKDKDLDQRTDIYSASIIFFELLLGRRVFNLENDLIELKSKIDEELFQIVTKGIDPKKENRFQTAKDMREILESYIESHKIYLGPNTIKKSINDLYRHEMCEATVNVDQLEKKALKSSILTPPPTFLKQKRLKKYYPYVLGSALALAVVFYISSRERLPSNLPNDESSNTAISNLSIKKPILKPKWIPKIDISSPNALITIKSGDQKWAKTSELKVLDTELNHETKKQYDLTIKRKGYKTAYKKLNLSHQKPHFTQNISLKLVQNGRLSIKATPWAEVSVAGYARQKETPFSLNIQEGSHTILAKYEDLTGKKHRLSKRIKILPNKNHNCVIAFDPKKYISCK